MVASLQSAVLFLLLWVAFRLIPEVRADTRAWLWRLSFLKPVLALLPFTLVVLPWLPAPSVESVEQVSFVSTTPISTVAPSDPVSAEVLEAEPVDPWLIAWGVGSASLAVLGLVRYAVVRRLVRGAQTVTAEHALAIYDQLRLRGKVSKSPLLVSSPDVSGALLIGGLQPRVLVPESVLAPENADDLRMMLAHELAHWVRRDLAWLTAISVVQAAFFFNPMVWIAGRQCRLAHESATDQLAAKWSDMPVHRYAEMLLRTSVSSRGTLPVAALPVAESYRTLYARLEAMKHFNHPLSPAKRVVTLAVAFGMIGLFPVYQLVEAAPPLQEKVAPSTRASSSKATASSPVKRQVKKAVKSSQIVITEANLQEAVKKGYFVMPNGQKVLISKSTQNALRLKLAQPKKPKTAPKAKPSRVLYRYPAAASAQDAPPVRVSGDIAVGAKAAIATDVPATQPRFRTESVKTVPASAARATTPAVVYTSRYQVAPEVQVTNSSPVAPAVRDFATASVPSKPVKLALVPTPATTKGVESQSQYSVIRAPKGPVYTYELQNVPATDAIDYLMKSAGKRYVLEGVTDRRLNLKVKDASFDQSLRALVKSAGYKIRYANGVYTIGQ